MPAPPRGYERARRQRLIDSTNPFTAPASSAPAPVDAPNVSIGIFSLFRAMRKTIAHDPATVLAALVVCSFSGQISAVLCTLPPFRTALEPETVQDFGRLAFVTLTGMAVWFLVLLGTTRICVAAHRGQTVRLLDILGEITELPRAGLTATVLYLGLFVGLAACLVPGLYIVSGLGMAYVVSLMEGRWLVSALRVSHRRTAGHRMMLLVVLLGAFAVAVVLFMTVFLLTDSPVVSGPILLTFQAFVPLVYATLYSMTAPADLRVTRN